MQRNRENNTVGKTRDLFKKIRDTKGTFHAKMGTIKDRNGMDQTEVLRRGAKNTQKNCMKKVFMTQITTVVLDTHLQPDILEWEVKQALGSITMSKASGGDRILAGLFGTMPSSNCCFLSCTQVS